MLSKNEIIASEIPKIAGVRVIDIGYAQSPNRELAKRCAVYGVDLVETDVPEYETTFKRDLNVEKLPFAESSIGAVTMGCTLAHLAHPLRVMADINRVLTLGGLLIITTPNPNYYRET